MKFQRLCYIIMFQDLIKCPELPSNTNWNPGFKSSWKFKRNTLPKNLHMLRKSIPTGFNALLTFKSIWWEKPILQNCRAHIENKMAIARHSKSLQMVFLYTLTRKASVKWVIGTGQFLLCFAVGLCGQLKYLMDKGGGRIDASNLFTRRVNL